ncbi:imidazoleglycerol phosphate synthase, cyclase subunit [Batrachochytrium salamandrivorans]|nr:imidazoleglycerol phosphate synthase, cyclase subunit [Batrachochytrium salamandrivorans]
MTTGLPPFTFDSSTDNTESSTLIDAGIYLLDYGAGNVRSLINAVHHLGFAIKHIKSAADFDLAKKIIFPGVGAFGSCMDKLDALGYIIPLKEYIASNRPFLGICVGMQCLFNFSEESPTTEGLGIIDATVSKFDSRSKTVPHMGWNAAMVQISKNYNPSEEPLINHAGVNSRYYFVHSFAVKGSHYSFKSSSNLKEWAYSLTTYGNETFISSVQRGNVFGTQFHPEKSGTPGLELLKTFLNTDLKLPLNASPMPLDALPSSSRVYTAPTDQLSRRIIACLDVRANDEGDLVVTKGDKYDVRVSTEAGGHVRNLGKPVELAKRYYEEGADEITFLNITSFRECPLRDFPMMQVLQKASESVFVPLTIGGGIREIVEPSGVVVSALDVASMYFRSGADKVSIGSDAVYAAEKFWMRGGVKYGDTSIEQISKAYGAQAVVVSVDPRRVYVHTEDQAAGYHTVACDVPGPSGELLCWYQCTVKGGREGRDLDVRQLVTACEALGAGEILLNCMDRDGTNSGFEHSLLCEAKSSVKIPVIASSGAGCVEHFSSMFLSTGADAGLAAGIFHRKEVPISK